MEKLSEDGEIGWWEEYEVLRRNFELDDKDGLVDKLKNKITAKNEMDWKKDVYTKNTLKCYRLAKDYTGVERYARLV